MPKERRIVREFLETYKFLPCLWDPKDKLYLNKDARSQALEILVDKYRIIDSEATVDLIKKRLENMRCAYKREYKKVLASRMQGKAEHVPSLWYYKHLLFLNENDPAVEKTDYSSGEDSDSAPLYTGPQKKRRRSTNGAAVYIVNKEEHSDPDPGSSEAIISSNYETFNSTINEDEADSFGKTVGLQLKRLDDMQRHIAEKLISEVVYYARLNQLNTRTTININEDFS